MRFMNMPKRFAPVVLAGAALLASATVSSAAVAPSVSSTSTTGKTSTGLPRPELRTIVAGRQASASGQPLDIAQYRNIYKKYGLNVKVEQFTSDHTEISALLAGQIQVALDCSTSSILASQLTSEPLESVFIASTRINDDLYSTHNITTAQQLIGKAIAVSSFASTSYGEALVALKQLKLTPQQVSITAVGDDAQRQAALLSGAVGASINDRAESNALTPQGVNVLVDLPKIKNADFPAGNVAATKGFVNSHPHTMLDLVAAITESTKLFLHNHQLGLQATMAEEGITHSAAQQYVIYDSQGYRPVNGYIKLYDYQESRVIYERSDPQLVSMQPRDAFTDKFVDQLAQSGWDKANGISTAGIPTT